jgi:predicted dehydrogenase
MISVGMVGIRNHAQRLRSLLECIVDVRWLYHPHRVIDDPRYTPDFQKLRECDAIVIASPNDTHVSYLRSLHDFDGYVLCEKPAATTMHEIHALEDLLGPPPERLMFNFPYRHAKFTKTLSRSLDRLGTVIGISITVGHGLAFKPEYAGSWRADASRHPQGVIETVGIHFIDLALSLFEKPCSMIKNMSSNVSRVGSSADTARIVFEVNHATVSIFVSYAMPFVFEVDVIGTDGRFTLRDGEMRLRAPRETFDERGFFIQPPIVCREPCEPEHEYEEALRASVTQFIETVDARKSFPLIDYVRAIEASRIAMKV